MYDRTTARNNGAPDARHQQNVVSCGSSEKLSHSSYLEVQPSSPRCVKIMDAPAATTPTGTRPYNGLLLAFFGVLSAAGLWFMRISTVLNDAPVGFLDIVASGTHPNGVVIKITYTHLKPVDEVLSFLVAAFLPGTAGWDEVFYWQQVHFLVQIGSLLAIMNVEACRTRNSGSWLK